MPKDPEILAHQEWLGYVQPVGLVVSIPALVSAGAYINRNFAPDHRRFLEALPADKDGQPVSEIRDFAAFAASFFGWAASDLYGSPGAPAVPSSLEVALPEYSETIRPTYALRDFDPSDSMREFLMLIQEFAPQTDFDAPAVAEARQWQASPQAKFERLLRQTGIQIGLLVNGRQIRLVYAPEKELSGHITFNIGDMISVAGRPICSAMLMLLCSERLYIGSPEQRLPAILANSRKYQNVVSTQLAEQVLEALYELLRGFQAAHDRANRELLGDVLARDPDHVYHGLLTVLLRLVFLLFAEDRGLLSTDPIYANNYSVTGLYDQLREDNGRYADLMDQRFGAWAQLLAVFRLIYSGGSHGAMRIPAREGYLFDPGRYLFLEGRKDRNDKPAIPRVSDGVVFRVLSKLFLLDGERLSYRTLAVEQIGSVYQAIMGFSLQVATGRSIAIRPAKRYGAPATIDLESLLGVPPDKRVERFTDETDQKLTGQAAEALKSAQTVDELLAAFERKIATAVTPMPVPKGAMVFQPSNERRRSGSHYTPSSLTGPIVEAALEPVLRRLGSSPTPAQILNLKVCDLAMGSAAFLVEACRQLGDALGKAWHAHNEVPAIPPDEDEALYAQRQIAQRCLYGVDKNPMAADLAKLSLWLATLAKDHPFTFLDHSLRSGDALVGLARQQIAAFHWTPAAQITDLEEKIRKKIEAVSTYRRQIFESRDDVPYATLRQKLDGAEDALSLPRQIGDAVIAAFFASEKAKERERRRTELLKELKVNLEDHGFIAVDGMIDEAIAKLKAGPKGAHPFHWELEFPEVFTFNDNGQPTGGFDLIVGNPPFVNGTRISTFHSAEYLFYITTAFPETGNRMDLVAYFFRRAFGLLRQGGTFGLIATNTIAQGDTRKGGLRWICLNGGEIYAARRRVPWPGAAAVTVSAIHVIRGPFYGSRLLDGKPVERLTAFLFHQGGSEDPLSLKTNAGKSFEGFKIYGQGFLFDDGDNKATSIAEMNRLIEFNPKNRERIQPYIGGDELNSSPRQQYRRYVINFGQLTLEEAEQWPELLQIVTEKVKPERGNDYRLPWWQFFRPRPQLASELKRRRSVLANSQVSSHLAFAFLPTDWIFSHGLTLITVSEYSAFANLQSRVHETWARFFSSSLEDRLRYTPTDCFETFPFPQDWLSDNALEHIGREYYEYRAELMMKTNLGLTETYNRFHDPGESDPVIEHLRSLHTWMDRAILNAYGWTDILPSCSFIPEFEDEEDADRDSEGSRPRVKKYRYRWPNDIRDEVLARLLELNRQRAIEEGQPLAGVPEPATPAKRNGKPRKPNAISVPEPVASLFADEKGDD
jgi:hypothetical protein